MFPDRLLEFFINSKASIDLPTVASVFAWLLERAVAAAQLTINAAVSNTAIPNPMMVRICGSLSREDCLLSPHAVIVRPRSLKLFGSGT